MAETEKFPGLGDRIRLRLRTLGYWKRGRPDVARFCAERGYRPQYVYAWLTDRVPGYRNLRRLEGDLGGSAAWILFGLEAGVGLPRDEPAGARAAPGDATLATAPTADTPPRGIPPPAPLLDLPRLREVTEQLQALQAELDGILRAFPDLYFWLDREGRIVSYREGRGSRVYLAPQAFLGKPLRDVAPPDVGPRIHEAFLEALHTDEVITVEYEIQVTEGPRHREARFLNLGRRRGTEPVVLAIVRDITERVRAEAATRALVEVGRELVGTLELSEATERVVTKVLEFFHARRAVVYELDAGSGGLTCVAVAGDDAPTWWLGRVLAPGEGLSGRAVAEGKAVWTTDALTDPRLTLPDWLRGAVDERYRAGIAVPLAARGETLGALVLSDAVGRVFTEGDAELLSGFANTAALGLANARLYTEAQRRRENAELLVTLGQLLSESLDPEELEGLIVASALILLSVRASVLWQLDPESGDLVAVAQAGDHGPLPPGPLRHVRGAGLSALAVEARHAVVTADLLRDPRITLTPETRVRIERSSVRAAMSVPLVVKGQVIGALAVGDREGRAFTEEDVRLLESFADRAALALANARLFEMAERSRRVAEAVAEVGRSFVRSRELSTVQQCIADGVLGLLAVQAVSLWQVEPETGDLVTVARAGDYGPIEGTLRYAAGTGLSGLVVREGRTVTTPDILADPRITLTPDARARIEKTALRAGLAVPLLVRNRAIGALAVADVSGRVFSEQEITLLRGFADQVAVTMEQAGRPG